TRGRHVAPRHGVGELLARGGGVAIGRERDLERGSITDDETPLRDHRVALDLCSRADRDDLALRELLRERGEADRPPLAWREIADRKRDRLRRVAVVHVTDDRIARSTDDRRPRDRLERL